MSDKPPVGALPAAWRELSARERTVRSTALLIRERGVAATGLRDVVEHAGAPRGSLQHYFPGGKDQLVAEALAWALGWAMRPLERLAEAEADPTPEQVVDAVTRRWRSMLPREGYAAGCPIVAAIADAGSSGSLVQAAVRQAFAAWQETLERILSRLDPALDPPAEVPRIAMFVLSAIEGAVLLSRVREDLEAFTAVEEAMSRALTPAR